LGEYHPDVAWTYYSIAQTHFKLINDPLKALDYIEKVNIIREKTIGKNHTYTLESFYLNGLILIELNRFIEAKKILDYAFDISKTRLDTPLKLLEDIKEAQLLCS
jgi:tetratricopeptide (TPR) repeat protein